jgi:hypothetical protein
MANSAEKLSHLLEQPKPESVIGLRGQQYDLVLAPVGNFVLVAVLPAGRYTVRLSISLGEVLASVADLTAHVMASTQQETSPAEIENLPISEALPPSMGEPVKEADQEPVGPPLEEFAQVFEEHVTQIKKDEADAFWDKAGKPKTGSLNKADVITYDEAQKLGLTPHENGEGKS